MRPVTAVAIYNTAIVVMIFAVTTLGYIYTGTANGLWSLMALFFVMNVKERSSGDDTRGKGEGEGFYDPEKD